MAVAGSGNSGELIPHPVVGSAGSRSRGTSCLFLVPFALTALACGNGRTVPDGGGDATDIATDVVVADDGIGDAEGGPIDYVQMRPGTDAAAFARGRAIFEHEFTTAEGLGPFYNDVSCRACHSRPATGGRGDYAHRVHQDELRPNHTPTGTTSYTPTEPFHIAPSLFGIGYLDEISDGQIASGCGVDAALGIHGIPGTVGTAPTIMRFGRGLQTRNIRAFVAGALDHELGLANAGSPDEPKSCTEDPNFPLVCGAGVHVDVDAGTINDLIAFVAGLESLPRLPSTTQGQAIFEQVGCATCHRIDAPYFQGTDLCRHDMGALAEPSDPPQAPPDDYLRLWGTTRLSGVRFSTLLLHDGRATTVDQAVRAHDGEGAIVNARYQALTDADREALLAFVMSL